MIRIWRIILFTILLMAGNAIPVGAQTTSAPIIVAPLAGDALQGIVTISGTNNNAGFSSSEISFSYSGDTTGTWFLIAMINSPLDGPLSMWDTTSITDGNYRLRLRTYLNDGSFKDAFVNNLRVRNYTPIETPTPAPTAVKPTLVPTITLTPTSFPTPTLMPANEAILTPKDVSISIAYGGVAAVTLLVLIGLYVWLRRK